MCFEVAAGDDGRLEELVRRRLELVPVLATEAPSDAAQAAIRRVVQLDGELLPLVRALQNSVRAALDRLRESSCALSAYRGDAPRSPLYVERLG